MATEILQIQSVGQQVSTLSHPTSTARTRYTVQFSAVNADLTSDNGGTQKSRIVISRTAVDAVSLQPTGRTSVVAVDFKDSIVNPHSQMTEMVTLLRGILADTAVIQKLMSGVVPTVALTVTTP